MKACKKVPVLEFLMRVLGVEGEETQIESKRYKEGGRGTKSEAKRVTESERDSNQSR